MRSRLNFWIAVLAAGALSLWLPTYLIIPLVAFALIQIVIEIKRGWRASYRRDGFRESYRTAEKVLEDIV